MQPLTRRILMTAIGVGIALQVFGCSPSDLLGRPSIIVPYDDTTESVHSSAFNTDADKELVAVIEPLTRNLSRGSEITAYTTTPPGISAPLPCFTKSIKQKLPPRDRQARARAICDELSQTLAQVRQRPPITDTTPLLEDVYALISHLQRLEGARRATRILIVKSDMEPFSPGILTLGEIITANPVQMDALKKRIIEKFPRPTLAPQRIIIVYLPTRMNARTLPPADVNKLLGFWQSLFKAWGVEQIEIREPHAYSSIPVEPQQGPFREAPGTEEQPTLLVENRDSGLHELTFTDGTKKMFTMGLPFHKETVLTLPAGVYDGRLEDSGSHLVMWTGRCRFRAYMHYETRYAPGKGAPLTFGEPE